MSSSELLATFLGELQVFFEIGVLQLMMVSGDEEGLLRM